MGEKKKLFPEKGLMMLSAITFLFLTTPAWGPGLCSAAVAAAALCLVVWKLPVTPEKIKDLLFRPALFALGIVVTSAFGCNFFNTWADSRYMLKIAGLLGMNVETFVFLGAAVGVLAAAPAVTCVLSYFITAGIHDFQQKNTETCLAAPDTKRISAKKAVLVLFVVYAVGISAILRANFYYQDDAGRAAFGYKDWDYFGRYLSTGLSTFLHMGNYLTDVAPLPQLLAMLLMAVSGVLMLYIVYDRTSFSKWELAAVVPLGLNPYFLECVSFRFEAPYMAISVLGAIVPLLYRKRSTVVYIFASMLGVLSVCTSYQAATGIFPMLVVLLAARMWNGGGTLKNAVIFCLKSVAGFGLGLLYFKMVIMKPADAGYVSNAMPDAGELIPNTLSNLKHYFELVRSDFKPFWLVLVLLMAAGFVTVMVRASKKKRGAALVMAAAALALMTLLCFGIYPVLASALFAPRAMYGFGVLIAILGVVAAEGSKHIPLKVPAIILSWTFFVFSFTYGNALSLQKEFTEFRIQMVIEDLNDMEVFTSDSPVTVQLSGSIGKSPILSNMPQDYQMLNRLVPETFAGGDDLTQYRFYCYYDLQNAVTDDIIDLTTFDLPVLKDSMYHTIRGEENLVLIELK